MTRRQEERFRRLLLKKHAELRGEIGVRQGVLSLAYVGDPIDRVQQLAERELAARDVDRVSAVLKSIEGALKEIEEGTFGVCAACGSAIPLKRLELVPWSPYCVGCQELAEQATADGHESEPWIGSAGADVHDLEHRLVA